jgi:hypothetical protein
MGEWFFLTWPLWFLLAWGAWNILAEHTVVTVLAALIGLAAMCLQRGARVVCQATRKYRFEPAVRRQPSRLEWEEMRRVAGDRCFYCEEVSLDLHAEHVIPVSRGGVSLPFNLVVSCARCNRAKGTKTGREFLRRPNAAQDARLKTIDALMARRTVPLRTRLVWHRQDLSRRNERRTAMRQQADRERYRD